MNKAIRKNVNHLRRLVGHKVIRTKPTAVGRDFSYTSDPLILNGFTKKGEMIVEFAEGTLERRLFSPRERTLPLHFTDCNWKLYSRVLNVEDSELSKWKGKKILRTTPSKRINDKSFMNEPAKLIAASKYHMIVEFTCRGLQGERCILNCDYTNPKEWKLAE